MAPVFFIKTTDLYKDSLVTVSWETSYDFHQDCESYEVCRWTIWGLPIGSLSGWYIYQNRPKLADLITVWILWIAAIVGFSCSISGWRVQIVANGIEWCPYQIQILKQGFALNNKDGKKLDHLWKKIIINSKVKLKMGGREFDYIQQAKAFQNKKHPNWLNFNP